MLGWGKRVWHERECYERRGKGIQPCSFLPKGYIRLFVRGRAVQGGSSTGVLFVTLIAIPSCKLWWNEGLPIGEKQHVVVGDHHTVIHFDSCENTTNKPHHQRIKSPTTNINKKHIQQHQISMKFQLMSHDRQTYILLLPNSIKIIVLSRTIGVKHTFGSRDHVQTMTSRI